MRNPARASASLQKGTPDAQAVRHSILKYVVEFLLALISLLGFEWLLIQLIEWVFKEKPLQGTGVLGALVLVLIALLLALASTAFLFFRDLSKERVEPSRESDDQRLADTLMTDLRQAYRDQSWEEVLKIGTVLSRPLWVTGKYKLRIELGKLMEAAAAFKNDRSLQARVLIDDLGWTRFILGEVVPARAHITYGLSLAELENNPYLICKGNRHLSGIAMSEGNLSDAENYHLKAKVAAQKISDPAAKQEAIAGIQANEALLRIERKEWAAALTEIENAQSLYQGIGDQDRYVKLFRFKGDILYEMHRLNDAKDTYRRGLAASKQASRKDGILMNNLGLAKVALRENDEEEARRAYSEAATTAHELGRLALASELARYATRLPLNAPDVKF